VESPIPGTVNGVDAEAGPQRPLPGWLTVRGAREHNLADVSVRLPHRSLVVFTGLSGSGKSTLAFDTIYAECQLRQVHSMSAFARQFLGEMDKPDVDAIDGLCCGVALDQRTASNNPRSTVGTATDVYDLLRILYARVGQPHCTACNAPLAREDVGWCCPHGHEGPAPELSPRAFSFNLPHGACPQCQGLGSQPKVDIDLVVPEPELSLAAGALAPWRAPAAQAELTVALAVARQLGADIETSWCKLPAKVRDTLLNGADEPIAPLSNEKTGRMTRKQLFHGIIPWLHRQYHDSFSSTGRDRVAAFMRSVPCQECGGARLNAAQRAVRVGRGQTGLGISELCARPVGGVLKFFQELDLEPGQQAIAEQAVQEVRERLEHLIDVGLHHLTLDRPAPTLSGGEAQRLRLAQQLGTGLFGLLYVLDEPTIGLHPADVDRLLGSLVRLRDQGNSVLVVEHDLQVVRAADWIVELGPGAGEDGGRLMYSGPLAGLLADENSLTGGHLSGRLTVGESRRRRTPDKARQLVVRGACEHNLANLEVEFPLGCFTAVTGVSGSGKSTLVDQVLYRAVARAIQDQPVVPGVHSRVDGMRLVNRVVRVDQSPIGRTPRSNPATYTGAFDPIRTLFARTEQAKKLGYKPGRFSFNTSGGRCETCAGDGVWRIDMRFLPEIFVPCDTCHGTRYDEATLQVRYRDLNIADVLALPVRNALKVFVDTEAVVRPLRALDEVGLGYLRLGQQATTLSGGEAQRVKLATELSSRATGHILYVLDEPTTGLHPEDVRRLLGVLHGLVDKGHTVVVVEHDIAVIASADWVIELGPGGGDRGGRLIAAGAPEDVLATPDSMTGPYLREALHSA
jgi:excinuclease ABC subunit A